MTHVKHRTRLVAAAVMALAVGVSQGCNINPYRLGGDGDDGGVLAPDGSVGHDGGVGHDAAITDAMPGIDACIPEPEVCDGTDNNCNGVIDEGFDLDNDPANCGACGVTCSRLNMDGFCNQGECEYQCRSGFHDIDPGVDGCEYACVPTNGGVERCDFTDNDCNGQVDEGFDLDEDVAHCGSCNRPCLPLNASPTCAGGVCGYSACNDGYHDIFSQVYGCEYACTETNGGVERCDGVDNDCNGLVDDGAVEGVGDECTDPGFEDIGDEGRCEFGAQACLFGNLQCIGYVRPRAERCNNMDDDCDGVIDNGFDKQNDPRYCGDCTPCVLPNAIPGCSEGECTILACLPGWVDLDGDPSNGCEYHCTPSGPEVCDGKDNNCNGKIDEADSSMLVPPNFCRQQGACAGTEPKCSESPCVPGEWAWRCPYVDAEVDSCGQLLLVEQECDGIDGNCNGQVDDSFTLKGTECDDGGLGVCRGVGAYVCNAVGDDVECEITTPGGQPSAEVCDGLDNDCDGIPDNGAPDDMILVDTGTAEFYIYTYEASRPDATVASFGAATHRSCSKPDVLPWRNVTWTQAASACAAAGARLCTEQEWQAACEGLAGNEYPYGDAYEKESCNGFDYDHDCTPPKDHQALPTGTAYGCPAPLASLCVSEWGAYDMSGNLKEWTATPASATARRIRGGAYDNVGRGLTCQFDFVSAEESFFFTNLGFRCCADVE